MNQLDRYRLTDKLAIVTGGLGQLGRAFSTALVEEGARVAVLDVATNPSAEDSAFSKHRDEGRIQTYRVDITKREELLACCATIAKRQGIPDVLINNAALDSPPNAPAADVGPFENYPESSFDRVMDVNVKGTFLCCQVFGGSMAAAGRGVIINISSIYGILSPCQDIYEFRRRQGETFFKPPAYSVSKSAVLNLTRYLATYWAKNGVRVNTLTFAGIFNHQPAEFLEEYCRRMPIGRMCRVEETIGPMLFLASDASSYMTGSNLVVDGGWTAW